MRIDLSEQPVYLLRDGNLAGAPVICSQLEMIKTLADSIRRTAGLPCTVVNAMGAGSLRWRILPKKEVRQLAADAHMAGELPLEDFLQIDFFFK